MARDELEIEFDEVDEEPVVVGSMASFHSLLDNAEREAATRPLVPTRSSEPSLADWISERKASSKRDLEAFRKGLLGSAPRQEEDTPEVQSSLPGDTVPEALRDENNPYMGLNPAKILAAINSGALSPHRKEQAITALRVYESMGENIFGRGPGDF